MNHSIAIALCAVSLPAISLVAVAQEPIKMSDDTIARAGERPAIETKEEAPDPSSVDGRLKIDGRVLEDVRLPGGTRVIFVEVRGGVGVYEQIPPGAPGTADFPSLRDAPMIDLFLAVTHPGTAVPPEIMGVSKTSKRLGPQGWVHMAGHVAPMAITSGYCSNSSFSNAVVSKGYDDRGTPKLRLDKQVGSTSFFKEHTECFGTSWVGGCPKFYRYEVGGNNGSVFSNVDKYYTRVAICGLGYHPTITSNYGLVWSHPGPVLDVSFRDSNNNGWTPVIHEDFTPGHIGAVRAWHYVGGAGFWNFDWRTRIYLAKTGDSFDIGHAVEDLGL